MKPSTAFNHRDRALALIKDIYALAPYSGYTSSVLFHKVDVVLCDLKKRGVPEKYIEYVKGAKDVIHNYFFQEHIVFRYKKGGKYYSLSRGDDMFPSWETLPREQWGDLTNQGAHYYKKSNKPYFVDKSHPEEEPTYKEAPNG